MDNGITIIIGTGPVLDFDHNGILPSVRNITDEALKLNIQIVDGVKVRSCVSYTTMLLGNRTNNTAFA